MSHKKIVELSKKFAELNINEKFNAQREKMSIFSDEFYASFRRILNEMEGDIMSLKYKGFEISTLKQFNGIFHNLLNISKEITSDNPYHAAKKLNEFLSDKMVLNNLKKIISLIKETLQSDNFGENLPGLKIDSINKIAKLNEFVKNYMANNPLLNVSLETSFPILQEEERKAGRDDVTNPAIPIAKKKMDI